MNNEEHINKIGQDFSLWGLLKFSFPSVLNNFFAQLFKTLDDGLFVSRFVGKSALAGINILNPINFFQFSLNNLYRNTVCSRAEYICFSASQSSGRG